MEIKKVTSKEELKKLYDCSALTWEGLSDIDGAVEELKKNGWLGDGFEVYVTKGEKMNEICNLKGKNAYPKNLNIVSITHTLVLALRVGARWIDDIIDNNADREKYHPFKSINYTEEFANE